jgi:hypothetical protein
MTPQERQLVDELFQRLSRLESAPRDPDATAAISQGLRSAPNAVYALVQTVLLQDEALKRANSRIQELEQAHAPGQSQSGGFLDSMRDAVFGSQSSRGSVPNVPPPAPARPVWNNGQGMQPPAGGYGQPAYGQAGYGQPPYGGAPSAFGGGGSFLGTAAAAAAGMVGGSLLLGGIRSMMGGSHYGISDPSLTGDRVAAPWGGDQADSSLARDAGVNDIGNNLGLASDHADDGARAGFLDQASNDDDDDRDDMDLDSDDFGNSGDSDYA